MWPWSYLEAWGECFGAFSCYSSPITLPGLLVRCLLVHFLLGTVLHVLLVEPPIWRSPVSGQVASLVTADLGVADCDGVEDARCEVHWISVSGPGRKSIRLNRKTPAHLAGLGVQSRPRVWKRLRHVVLSVDLSADCRRRLYDQRDDGYLLVQNRTGVG